MALFDDAMFAPQSGIPAWLGDLLKMAQANPTPSQGFPQSQPVPMPQPRPDIELPQNAQPAQGGPLQPQQMPRQQFMGPGGSLQTTLYQIAGALNPSLRHLAQDAQTQQSTAIARQYLASKGLDPAMAHLVASNPTALGGYLQNQMGLKEQTQDIKEYEFAKRHDGYKGTFQDWMANKRAGAGEYGLNGIWGTGPDGKPAIIQLGKNGTPNLVPLPQGFQPNKDAQKIDLGTHWGILDPTTRQLVTTIPKDLRGKEREEAIGTDQGKATQGLPAVETTVNSAIETINKLRTHPGLELGTGATGKVARQIWGTPAYDFDALNKQASGKAFMGAREALKGAGQVTDFEGGKGEQAIANLDAAQSKKAYLEALDTLERMMRASLNDLKKKAGIAAAAPTPSAGGVPSIDDLVKKYSR